jgi:UDP-GlcNAc:undecaprenyl-phosphate/decaprenyl-phosphate GlcNAc-1-phosphate transferase
MVMYVLVLTMAIIMALVLTPAIRRFGWRAGCLDLPTKRKIHQIPVPRIGGVAIYLTVLSVLFIAGLCYPGTHAAAWYATLMGGTLVFLIGLWDDFSSRGTTTKFIVQIIAGYVAIALGVRIDHVTIAGVIYPLGPFASAVTLLWIIGLTNAFNLVDGMDGLACTLALIAAITCATITLVRGDMAGSVLLLALIGALIGFLRYNFHPASIFLGDSGSLFIGYVLAVNAITSFQKGAAALTIIAPLLTFALPIADTLFAVFRRWNTNGLIHALEADHGHIHHRLLAQGISQRGVVFILCTIAVVLSLLALATSDLR